MGIFQSCGVGAGLYRVEWTRGAVRSCPWQSWCCREARACSAPSSHLPPPPGAQLALEGSPRMTSPPALGCRRCRELPPKVC